LKGGKGGTFMAGPGWHLTSLGHWLGLAGPLIVKLLKSSPFT